MRTALHVKIARGQRVGSASRAEYCMEFSDLLDGIAEPVVAAPDPDPVPAELDLGLADLVMFPVLHRFDPPPVAEIEPVEEQVEEPVAVQVAPPPTVSRFADTGLDDDLLPVHAPRRRLRR